MVISWWYNHKSVYRACHFQLYVHVHCAVFLFPAKYFVVHVLDMVYIVIIIYMYIVIHVHVYVIVCIYDYIYTSTKFTLYHWISSVVTGKKNVHKCTCMMHMYIVHTVWCTCTLFRLSYTHVQDREGRGSGILPNSTCTCKCN